MARLLLLALTAAGELAVNVNTLQKGENQVKSDFL
jgi:hypothetical protein